MQMQKYNKQAVVKGESGGDSGMSYTKSQNNGVWLT
jgi:hypothetical protein